MTPQEGQRRIKKLLGAKAAWHDRGVTTSDEIRMGNMEVFRGANKDYQGALATQEARKRELLADPEYQRMVCETARLKKAMQEAQAITLSSYRLTVGLKYDWCFEVKAEGDNWADVVRKLEAKSA